MARKLSLQVFQEVRYGYGWQDHVDLEEAREFYTKSVRACKDAINFYLSDRKKLEILVVHGSSRSVVSCPAELSNSQFLLEKGLEVVGKTEANITRINLGEYQIEPCRGCTSTCSAHCHAPCSCYIDPMHKLYPKVLRADVLLISTPVNQHAMSSRLKLFVDRLISLDGGYALQPKDFGFKDEEFKNKSLALSLNQEVHYDQRLFGKVAAYFISSKDEMNDLDDANLPTGQTSNYVSEVAHSLQHGFEDYGVFHPEPAYAWWAGNPHVEYAYDKAYLNAATDAHVRAQEVVRAAVELAKQLRDDPPKFKGGGRINRT